MARKIDRFRELHVQQAAYLRGQYHMSQCDIGRILGGMSQAHVSRLLKLAEQMGYLVTQVRFVGDDLADEDIAQLRKLHEPRPLALALEQLGRRDDLFIPNVCVFDSGSNANSAEAYIGRRKRIGKAAAGRLDELLQGVESIGVTWGNTVAGLIEGLGALKPAPAAGKKLLVVPVCAEQLGLATPECSSSRLANRLSEIVNSPAAEQLSLAGVPACIPRSHSKEKSTVIKEFVAESESCAAIFGRAGAMIDKLDGLLTSVGSTLQSVGGNTGQLLAARGIDATTLHSLVVGDIGGALIARESLGAEDRRLVDQLNQMWTGIGLDQMREIAHRATEDKHRVGCVIVAVGKERAPVTFEAIRRGLVNELLVDQDLARALGELVDQYLVSRVA